MRRGHAGALEGALFALAAFVKPNVLGAAAGVVACTLATGGRRALPMLAGAASADEAAYAAVERSAPREQLAQATSATARRDEAAAP